jgi:hypothetical protein
MDSNAHLLDVQLSESNGNGLPGDTSTNLLERTTLLKLSSPEQVEAILTKFNALEYPRERAEQFMYYLLQDAKTWWVDLGGEGVVYLTGVFAGVTANVNVIFWDNHISVERREVVLCTLATAIDLFELPRITALVHERNNHLKFFYKKIGFVLEGTIRHGARMADNSWADLIMYGLLREEVGPCLRLRI